MAERVRTMVVPVIIQPDGPQGPKFTVAFTSKEQFKKYDMEVGKLPIQDRLNIQKLKATAIKLGINIVDN